MVELSFRVDLKFGSYFRTGRVKKLRLDFSELVVPGDDEAAIIQDSNAGRSLKIDRRRIGKKLAAELYARSSEKPHLNPVCAAATKDAVASLKGDEEPAIGEPGYCCRHPKIKTLHADADTAAVRPCDDEAPTTETCDSGKDLIACSLRIDKEFASKLSARSGIDLALDISVCERLIVIFPNDDKPAGAQDGDVRPFLIAKCLRIDAKRAATRLKSHCHHCRSLPIRSIDVACGPQQAAILNGVLVATSFRAAAQKYVKHPFSRSGAEFAELAESLVAAKPGYDKFPQKR